MLRLDGRIYNMREIVAVNAPPNKPNQGLVRQRKPVVDFEKVVASPTGPVCHAGVTPVSSLARIESNLGD